MHHFDFHNLRFIGIYTQNPKRLGGEDEDHGITFAKEENEEIRRFNVAADTQDYAGCVFICHDLVMHVVLVYQAWRRRG